MRQERSPALSLLILLAGTVGSQVLTLFTGIVSARLLGVEGRGQFALVVAACTTVGALSVSGLPVAVSTQLARTGLPARRALRPFRRRWAAASVAVGLLPAAYAFAVLDDLATPARTVVAVLAVVLTAALIETAILNAMLQGELASAARLVGGAFLLIGPYSITMAALLVVTRDAGAAVVMAAFTGASAVGLLLARRLLRPRSAEPAKDAGATELDAAALRRTWRANYLNGLTPLDGLGIDRNLIGLTLGSFSLGLYSVAAAFANLCTVVGVGASSMLLPRLAAADGAGQRELLRRWLPLTAGVVALVVLVVEALLAPVLRLAFGADFDDAVAVARWLIVADGLLGYRRVLVAVLQARDRGEIASRIEVLLTVVLVGGLLLAARLDSLEAAGAAMATVGLLSCALLAVAIRLTPPGRRRAQTSRRRPSAKATPAAGPDSISR